MKKSFRKPHQYKRKKSIFRNRFFWLGILFFIFIVSLSYFFFLSDFFQLEKIIVTGEKKVSQEDIKSFIPLKNIFLIDTKIIREDILNTFPQIAEVEIKRGLPDSLSIIVVERLAVAVFCWEENCFLLDSEGVIFEELVEVQPRPMVVVRDLFWGKKKELKLGEKVIDRERLSQILEIEPKLKLDLKIPIKEFEIISEDKLIVLTSDGWEIYFNLKGDIGWQITKLEAVLEEKIPKEQRKNLEYIELRFGNFAPFKYRD